MADTQVSPLGTVAAPADWTLPPAQVLTIAALFAHFDGSGAGSAYVPTVQIISDAGKTILEVPMDASVAAGSSVEATWAPFLRASAISAPGPPGTVPKAELARGTKAGFAGGGVGATNTAVVLVSWTRTSNAYFDFDAVNGRIGIDLPGTYVVITDALKNGSAAANFPPLIIIRNNWTTQAAPAGTATSMGSGGSALLNAHYPDLSSTLASGLMGGAIQIVSLTTANLATPVYVQPWVTANAGTGAWGFGTITTTIYRVAEVISAVPF